MNEPTNILTIEEANRIAAGKATVSVDQVDASMWQVDADGVLESHEPMVEGDWRAWLAAYAADTAPPVCVEDLGPKQDLQAALRENLRPDGIVAIAAFLQVGLGRTNDDVVNQQVRWLHDLLLELVGTDEFNRVSDQLGL